MPFGQHKGNAFTDLVDDYLPLARSYTLSREMNMYAKQRDAIVSHIDREIARRAEVARVQRLEERAREFNKVYADATGFDVDTLIAFLGERGCLSLRVNDERGGVQWEWAERLETDECNYLKRVIGARVDDILKRLRVLEEEAAERAFDEASRRYGLVYEQFSKGGLASCWLWTGEQNAKGLPKVTGESFAPARAVFEWERMDMEDWTTTTKVCGERLCVNPWHRLTPDTMATVIALGLAKFYEAPLDAARTSGGSP